MNEISRIVAAQVECDEQVDRLLSQRPALPKLDVNKNAVAEVSETAFHVRSGSWYLTLSHGEALALAEFVLRYLSTPVNPPGDTTCTTCSP